MGLKYNSILLSFSPLNNDYFAQFNLVSVNFDIRPCSMAEVCIDISQF